MVPLIPTPPRVYLGGYAPPPLEHPFRPHTTFVHRERKAVEGAAGEVEARREEVDTEDDATGEVEAGLAEADAEDGAARGIEDEGEKKADVVPGKREPSHRVDSALAT
uniref:Uncharacterized protein n=1 Tax=Oryza sativa subsp. japonica TaxID=39947 RepID=Q8LN46_ORYSJ|nr:hypothetical protein [Oryza sativa Japonica Group]